MAPGPRDRAGGGPRRAGRPRSCRGTARQSRRVGTPERTGRDRQPDDANGFLAFGRGAAPVPIAHGGSGPARPGQPAWLAKEALTAAPCRLLRAGDALRLGCRSSRPWRVSGQRVPGAGERPGRRIDGRHRRAQAGQRQTRSSARRPCAGSGGARDPADHAPFRHRCPIRRRGVPGVHARAAPGAARPAGREGSRHGGFKDRGRPCVGLNARTRRARRKRPSVLRLASVGWPTGC